MNRTHGHPWFARAAARAALLALVCIAAGAVTFAVEQTGELKGTVRDNKGKPLPGVTAALSGVNLQGTRGAVSNANGEIVFRVLPPGSYTLRLSLEGYQSTEIDNVEINVGRTTTVPVDLPPGKLTEQVTVSASAPLVDTVRTQTQDNYTPEYLQKVQIGSGGRNYLSVISNSAGTGPGDGGNPTVRGSTIGQNVYLIDGVDSTDPVTETFGSNFGFDLIQEIQFQSRLRGLSTMALLAPDVASELNLTDDQKQKLNALTKEFMPKQNDLMAVVGGKKGSGDREGLAKLREEYTTKAMEVLTAEQKETLNKLKGNEFDLSKFVPPRTTQGKGN